MAVLTLRFVFSCFRAFVMSQWAARVVVVFAAVFAHSTSSSTIAAAGPDVHLVIAKSAPKLEQFAARELTEQLKSLFDAKVTVTNELPVGAVNVVLVGSPKSNPVVRAAIGDAWPKLSDQGHCVRSFAHDGKTMLVVGGGSPVATLWAVYELGHHFGIRYLLRGDILPALVQPFKLDGIDIMLEPALRLRTWRTINDFPIGPESWGLADQKRLLRQLAKMKFNRVMLAMYPYQPFVHYEYRGVKKQMAHLWFGYRYPIDAAMAGRNAFAAEGLFDNPDFAGKTSYEERLKAGVQLAGGIIDAAHELGMSAGIAISPLEFPKEFAAALPDAKVLYTLEKLVIGPGKRQPPDDPAIRELAAAQIRAFLKTYPTLDALYLTLPEFPEWIEHYEAAWKRLDERTGIAKIVSLDKLTESARARKVIASGERGVAALRGNLVSLEFLHRLLADGKLLTRPDGKKVQLVIVEADPALYVVLDMVIPPGASTLIFVDYTARRVAANANLLEPVPAKKLKSSLIFTLADDNVGVLPQSATGHLHKLVQSIHSRGWEGFSTRYWIVNDLNETVHYLSRAGFDAKLTPRTAYADLYDAMAGAGVADRVAKALELIEQATDVIDQNDIGFTFPVPGMVMKHYTKGPPPAWWKTVADLYAGAMDEIYRAHQRAPVGPGPLLLHHAKRLEFATEYLASVEALRLAGQAKAAGQTDKQIEHLEKAVESMYNALSAQAEVARDQSDRGVIAVLNEYGYRPLKAELEAAGKK